METFYNFKDIKIRFDPTLTKTWIGNAPDKLNYFGQGSRSNAQHFEIAVTHTNFDINLNCIYWEGTSMYELNPNVVRGSEALQTLRSRLRLTAKQERIQGQELFIVQLKVGKLKNTFPLHSNLFDSNEHQLSSLCELDIRRNLINECGCLYLDTKRKLTGDAGTKREKQFVAFRKGNYKAMINLFLMTRVYPMLKNFHE